MSSNQSALDKKSAVVTGASRALGLAIAKSIIAKKGSVGIYGRDPSTMESASSEVASCRTIGVPCRADVADIQRVVI